METTNILGPLLFCIFVNDLPAALPNCKVMMYEDDTTVYFADTNATMQQQYKKYSMKGWVYHYKKWPVLPCFTARCHH